MHNHEAKQKIVNHKYNTKGILKCNLKIPQSKWCIGYIRPKCYNQLPDEIRSISYSKTFSQNVRKYISENIEKFIKLFWCLLVIKTDNSHRGKV